ncbi:MAG: hypothetical protein WC357_03030 [Candidatus Omnitrophota bacterium]|jgi:hypothetical protein
MKTINLKKTNENTIEPKELILGVIDTTNYKVSGDMMKMAIIRDAISKATDSIELEDADFEMLKKFITEYPNYQGIGAVDVLKRFEI